MFDLEQAITEWRRQMLAAGIKSPVPLEELEIHLREEIERQMKSGIHEQEAFEIAVQRVGQAGKLKTEFSKANGLLGWLGENKSVRTNQILGALWLVQCLWFLIHLTPVFIKVIPFPQSWLTFGFVFLAFNLLLDLAGAFGGVCLIRGAKLGRNIIGMLALYGLALCALQILKFRSLSAFGGILVTFDLISIWLLFSPNHPKLKAAK